jgi:TatD DNase family protein
MDEIENLPAVLERASRAGIEAIVAVGSDYESNKRVLEISRSYSEPKIYPALGIHPWGLRDSRWQRALKQIEEHIWDIVAIGEIGLDFWLKEARKDGPGRGLQKKVFLAQLELAKKFGKPAIIHSRGAWEDCLKAAKEMEIEKAVFHWYSGPVDTLRQIIKSGYLVSASPSCEYSRQHRRAINETPIEAILLETDSPVTYKPPGGQYIAQPKDIIKTLRAVAQLKRLPENQVAMYTRKNAVGFFSLEVE